MSYGYNENLLKYARAEVKNAGRFSSSGTVFKGFRIAYIILAAYSVMACIAVMLGNAVMMREYSAKTTSDMVSAYSEQRNYLITMIISVIVIVACFVFLKMKRGIPLSAAGCVNCVIAFTVFYGVSVDNDVVNGGMGHFWGLFGIPSILCAALAIALGVMLTVEKRKVKKEYDRIVSALYASFSNESGEGIDSAAFEEYMNSYKGGEIFRNDIPLKKSLRRRKEKNDRQSSRDGM